jgi:hypothetical protein
MIRIKCLIVFFCFGVFLNTKAQSPGYMGKKTVAGYGFYFNPAFAAALFDYGTNIINTQHEFFIERAVKKRLSLGFSIKLYRTTYNNTGKLTDVGSNTPPSGDYSIKARNYAFYLKLYRRQYVAPWGRYFLIGITYNKYASTYDPDKMSITQTTYVPATRSYLNYELSDFGPTTQSFKYPDIMMGHGNSRIIANKFCIDYGYSLNLFAATVTILDAFDDSNKELENYIQKTSAMRVRGINRFNFFVKIGYLF